MYFNICLQEQNHERSELSNLQPVLKPRKKGFLPICFHTFFFSIDKTTPIEVSIFLLCNTFVKALSPITLQTVFMLSLKSATKKNSIMSVCMFVSTLQLKYCSAYLLTSVFYICTTKYYQNIYKVCSIYK